MHYPPVRRTLTFDRPESSNGADEGIKVSLTALNQCWENMQTQVKYKSLQTFSL